MESSKEIDITSSTSTDDCISTTLVELPSIQNFQKIIVDVKVLDAPIPSTVSSGKSKQDVVIADNTATSKVVLWEDHIGSLLENCSYTLKNFVVREYGTKYLSMPREGSEIISIEDIGEVEDFIDTLEEQQQRRTLHDAQIIAVPYLDSYKGCIHCKARVEPISPLLGRCSKDGCLMSQRYDFCVKQCSAKLMMQHGRDKDVFTLHAFGNILSQLADPATGEEITAEELLHSSKLSTVTYNDKMIVTSFSWN